MRCLYWIIYILLTPLAHAQDTVFDYLIFDPEDPNPFLFVSKETNPPKSDTPISDEAVFPKISKRPIRDFTVHQGDILNLNLDDFVSNAKINWLLNGDVICNSAKCEIDTSKWSQGSYGLILQIENNYGFKSFTTNIFIKKRPYNKSIQLINLPFIEEVEADDESQEGEILGKSIEGIAFIEKSMRSISTRLGRTFVATENHKVRTSTESKTLFVIPKNFELLLIKSGEIKLNQKHATLKKGMIRVRTAPSNWTFGTEDEFKVSSKESADFTIIKKSNKTIIFPFEGDLIVQIPIDKFLPSNERLNLLYRRQIISEQGSMVKIKIYPGQALTFYQNILSIASNSNIKLISIIKESSPQWTSKSTPQLFSITLPIDQQLIVKDNFARAVANLKIGLLRRSKVYWNRLSNNQKENSKYHQKLLEIDILRKNWDQALDFINDLDNQISENEFFRYYKAVSHYNLGQIISAKETFKEILWTAQNEQIIASCQQFLDFIDRNKRLHIIASVTWENNNNPAGLNDEQSIPFELFHKASQGIRTDSQLSYTFTDNQLFQTRATLDLELDIWLKEGLNNLGFFKTTLALETSVRSTPYVVAFAPYFGRSNIGKYSGLDHFGFISSIVLENYSLKPKITYDHSKNLDTAANDDSFIDPITKVYAESEDRSRQIQNLGLELTINQQLYTKFQIKNITFRADSTKDESGFDMSGDIRYRKAWSQKLSSILSLNVGNNSMDSRTDQTLALCGQTLFQWFPSLGLKAYASFQQNNSSSGIYSFSKQIFGLGIKVEY